MRYNFNINAINHGNDLVQIHEQIINEFDTFREKGFGLFRSVITDLIGGKIRNDVGGVVEESEEPV